MNDIKQKAFEQGKKQSDEEWLGYAKGKDKVPMDIHDEEIRQKIAQKIFAELEKENHEHGIDKRLLSVRVDFWEKLKQKFGGVING